MLDPDRAGALLMIAGSVLALIGAVGVMLWKAER